jgi:hypothetical protein
VDRLCGWGNDEGEQSNQPNAIAYVPIYDQTNIKKQKEVTDIDHLNGVLTRLAEM